MKTKIFGFLCCAGLVAFLFSGENFRSSAFKRLSYTVSQYFVPFVPGDEGVTVVAKAYTSEESKQFLGKDLSSQGIQPVQLTIENNTSKFLNISPDNVTLPTVSSRSVARKVMNGSIPRSIAFKVAGFFFWPFMIPGTIDSIRTYHAHKMMKKDFSAKSIRNETILPYSTLNRILFVPMNEIKQYFTVTLLDPDNNRNLTYQATTS